MSETDASAVPDGSTVHATALVVGEAGVLVEGPSGSGKSRLAEAIIAGAAARGGFASLVGDDRVVLAARGGRLVARPHPVLAGLIERRGVGLVRVPHEAACVVVLVVRLRPGPPARLPETPPRCLRAGVDLPLLDLPVADSIGDRARAVLLALGTAASQGLEIL